MQEYTGLSYPSPVRGTFIAKRRTRAQYLDFDNSPTPEGYAHTIIRQMLAPWNWVKGHKDNLIMANTFPANCHFSTLTLFDLELQFHWTPNEAGELRRRIYLM